VHASAPTPESIELRERILDAAAELFAKKSFAGTTTEEIANAVGELRGTVYYHFENKEAILEGIQDRLTTQLVGGLVESRDEADSAAARLEAMIGVFVDFALEYPNAFATSLEDLKYLSPKARKKAERRSDKVRLLLADAIAEAAAEDPHPGVDSGIAAVTILYGLSMSYRWYRPSGRLSRDEVGRELKAQLLGGLRADRQPA
jgi:TetR/AcrR family transcriptional regulator, cholesterol catabolism regulator